MTAAVASSSVAVQTFTGTAPSGVSAGDLLVAVCYDSQGAAQTFTAATGWSAPSANASFASVGSGSIYVFYKYATGTDSYAFTGSGAVADVAIGVLRVTGGPASGDPFDAIGYSGILAGGSAATMPGAAAIASHANDLAICAYGGWDAQAVTTGPSGMTAGASGAGPVNTVSLFTYWQTLAGQYGVIGNRPVTWATADGVANCTILVRDASPSAPGTVFTQRSNATLLGGETHATPGAASMTQSLATVAAGDLVVMFIHWTGSGISVSSVSSSHVTWNPSAAVSGTGSATGYHFEVWWGVVTSVTTATVTVSFTGTDTFGTELGFDEWGSSAGSIWSVQATAVVDSGATTNQDTTSAQVTATADGLVWTYTVTDIAGSFGLTGDFGYYFTIDASNGTPISWRYDLTASAAYQSSAWTPGSAGRWNGGAVVFQAASPPGPQVLPYAGGKAYRRRKAVRRVHPLLFTAPPAAPQAGPPVYPLGRPVQAKGGPQRGGHVSSRAGTYQGTGPPARHPSGPVKAQPASPVLAGRARGRAGPFAGLGPALRALAAAVTARLRVLPPRGRTAGRAGAYGGAGPAVTPPHGPVRTRVAPPPAGRTASRDGTFTQVTLGSGPPVYPLGHPVQARRLPQRGGAAAHRAGTYAGTGPALKPPDGPVQARQPLQARGRAAGRTGTYTAVVTGSGPPVYPLGHPVQARRQAAQGGRVIRRAGTYAGTGPPVKAASGPVGVYRRQPPPPARGRAASQRGPYAGTGPPVRPLGHALRARPQAPVLYGRADWRAGTAVFIPPPPFTIGTLTASDVPGSTLSAAGASSALTAATAATGTLTAQDQRTGGPG
jgi:hypothetical protein